MIYVGQRRKPVKIRIGDWGEGPQRGSLAESARTNPQKLPPPTHPHRRANPPPRLRRHYLHLQGTAHRRAPRGMANHPARGHSAALSTPSQPCLAAPSTTSRNKHWTYSKPPQPRTPQRSHLPQHHPHPTTPRPPRRRIPAADAQLADIDATPTPQTVALAHKIHELASTE
jgi:hypothetical protein